MRASIVSTLVVATTLLTSAAMAQTAQRQYSAKFICGKATPVEINAFLAAPGTYYTAINVHNPRLQNFITFRKKFAIGLPNQKVGPISPWFTTTLKADEVLQVDCGDIYLKFGIAAGTFIEGFAVIQPDSDLDVVAVYTADGGAGVSTLHTERVPLRNTIP
jgi:hypothetical protein